METRKCTKCSKIQPLEAYRIIKRGNPRRETNCISCRKEYFKKYRQDNKKLHSAQHRIWRLRKKVAELKGIVKVYEDGIKANYIAKNDTIILDSDVIVPESKEYFIISGGFGQLIFDENDSVSNVVISYGSIRYTLKKID